MLLTELLIAGGALCAGVTAYKKRQKKKKLGDFLQAGTKSKNNNKVMPTSIYGEVKAAIEKFEQENISLFFDDVRNQQLKEILSADAWR